MFSVLFMMISAVLDSETEGSSMDTSYIEVMSVVVILSRILNTIIIVIICSLSNL